MIRLKQTRLALTAALLAVALSSGAALAQTTPPPPAATPAATAKAEPSAWDKTKSMSRREWNAAKRKWAAEKAKWRDCNAKSRSQMLRGTKRWTFIGHCMTD